MNKFITIVTLIKGIVRMYFITSLNIYAMDAKQLATLFSKNQVFLSNSTSYERL